MYTNLSWLEVRKADSWMLVCMNAQRIKNILTPMQKYSNALVLRIMEHL